MRDLGNAFWRFWTGRYAAWLTFGLVAGALADRWLPARAIREANAAAAS